MSGHDGARAVPGVMVVELDFEPLTEHTTGLWCDRCLLPSAVSLTGVITVDGKPWCIQTYVGCSECETVRCG